MTREPDKSPGLASCFPVALCFPGLARMSFFCLLFGTSEKPGPTSSLPIGKAARHEFFVFDQVAALGLTCDTYHIILTTSGSYHNAFLEGKDKGRLSPEKALGANLMPRSSLVPKSMRKGRF